MGGPKTSIYSLSNYLLHAQHSLRDTNLDLLPQTSKNN